MLLGAIAASRFIFGNNPNPGPSAILDSAFAWYRLDDVEPSGILFDSSSNAAHGTYSSTVLSTDGLSRAKRAYQPRGRTTNGAFYPASAAWNAGANDPGGWIISFFLQRDPAVSGGSIIQFLWGIGSGSGNYAGFCMDGNDLYISLTSSHYKQSTRPVLRVPNTLEACQVTVVYRRNYIAEGRDKYAGYINGIRVAVARENSSNPVNCGNSVIIAGNWSNYESSYGNNYRLNDMVSAPNPYTTDATEAVAVYELWQALKPSGIVPATPPTFSNVLSLLHFEESNVYPVIDQTGKTWTAHGSVAVLEDSSTPFGNKLLFNGSLGYIESQIESDFNFGSGNFCWEFKVKASGSQVQTHPCVLYFSPTGAGWGTNVVQIHVDRPDQHAGKLSVWFYNYSNSVPILVSKTLMLDDTEHDITIDRDGVNLRLFIDGVLEDITFWSGSLTSVPLLSRIGYAGDFDTVTLFKGTVDELRISNVSRCRQSFTPSTTPFPDE